MNKDDISLKLLQDKIHSRAKSPPPKAVSIAEFKKIQKQTGNSKNINEMKHTLKHNNLEFVPEFQFSPDRKFKSDIYIPSLNLLIEYEGLVFNAGQKGTGKSGHTTVTGYSSNCEKYNHATLLGFKLLRYTAMNYKTMMNDIRELQKASQ